MSRTLYTVRATYDTAAGGWLKIRVDEIPGVMVRAQTRDEVAVVAREAIASELAVEEGSFDLAIEFEERRKSPR